MKASNIYKARLHVHPPPLPTHYGFIKNLQQILVRVNHGKFLEEIKQRILQDHICLVKIDKIVFSKLTWEISLSVSDEQVSKQLDYSFPISNFQILSISRLLGCYFSMYVCVHSCIYECMYIFISNYVCNYVCNYICSAYNNVCIYSYL